MKINFEYSKLRGRIKEKFGTESKFANEIGLNKGSLSDRLNNKTEFKQPEILESMEKLEIKNEEIVQYFFTRKVRKSEL